MHLLKQIPCAVELTPASRIDHRDAVRAVILKERRLLMITSPINRDYMFPGGGIEPGESHARALTREVFEEAGAVLTAVLGELGRVVECHPSKDAAFDVFEMTSHYYWCEVDGSDHFSIERLESYERDLMYAPVWVEVEAALRHNLKLMESPAGSVPRWLPRETFILEHIHQKLARRK